MTATIFLPFNFNPVSVQVFTSGSYTIPSNRYAFVTASCDITSEFSINSTIALRGTQTKTLPIAAINSSINNAATASYTVPSNSIAELLMAINNDSGSSVNVSWSVGSYPISATGYAISNGNHYCIGHTTTGNPANNRHAVPVSYFKVGPGIVCQITGTNSTQFRYYFNGYSRRFDDVTTPQIVTASYWLPPSTVLSSSNGARFVVSLYEF